MSTLIPIIAIVALIVVTPTFWWLQIQSGFWSTRYFIQVGILTFLGVCGLYLSAWLLTSPGLQDNAFIVIVALVILGVSIYHLALAFVKLTIESDSRYRRFHKADRAVVRYDYPHERFALETSDGVRLQALKITHNVPKSEKAIIVCHGAGRSKNTIPVVQTCTVLSTKYHVFTFDFRGHMESGGTFQVDGDTEPDLQAMIDYLEKAGYSRIAVVGWSIGAWTALLAASKGRHIDAIVAGAPPPIGIEETTHIKLLRQFYFLQWPIRGAVSVFRQMRTRLGDYSMGIKDFIKQVPATLPVLFVYNDYDTTTHVDASAFEKIYDQLPARKEKMRLPGNGHFFDWPNTFFVMTKIFEWLDQNF